MCGFPLRVVVALACAATVLGWNWARFAGAKAEIRTKDLSFLPSPTVAKLLAIGHPQTVAKLRWIDSFAYFQRQLELEKADDHVHGGGKGGFELLYDTLIELDPHYQPFYEHVQLNLGGVLGRNGPVLTYLYRGLMEMPHNMTLWRMTAAELVTNFDLEKRQPIAFTAFLSQWAANAPDDEQRQYVWDWRSGMNRRQKLGIGEVEYWRDQLATSARGSDSEQFLAAAAREAVAKLNLGQLQRVLNAATSAGMAPQRIEDLADAQVLRSAFPIRPAYLPFRDGRFLPDPYGHAFVVRAATTSLSLDSAQLSLHSAQLSLASAQLSLASATTAAATLTVVSPGLERVACDRLVAGTNILIGQWAQKNGHWPASASAAAALSRRPMHVPAGGTLAWDGKRLSVIWTPAPFAPWDPRLPWTSRN